MAPSYASLFMGKLENDFLEKRLLKPYLWLRFLDDIFMIWNYSLEDLYDFIDCLNKLHPTIKFTFNVSNTKVSFLDVEVVKNENNDIATMVHVKNTNIHQYVEYSSCHPKSCKDGIPYSQAKRYRRIISDDNIFKSSLTELGQHFLNRNYPINIINTAFQKVSSLTQLESIQCRIKDKNKAIIPFVIEYNPSLPNIGISINKYWDLLKLSSKTSVKSLHKSKPMLAYKRPKNLKDYLISSKLEKTYKNGSSTKCNRPRCSHCSFINENTSFNSMYTKETFNMRCDTNCATSNVIYLITCKKCSIQYIGQTSQQLSKRMNQHRSDIKNYIDHNFNSHVVKHFNKSSHTLQHFSFQPIDIVNSDMERLLKETYWIHRLNTVYPKGLNSKALYDIP